MTFAVSFGPVGAQAQLEFAQGSHQSLSIKLDAMARLRMDRLEGLLGTEKHDSSIEQRTCGCIVQLMNEGHLAWGDANAAGRPDCTNARTRLPPMDVPDRSDLRKRKEANLFAPYATSE